MTKQKIMEIYNKQITVVDVLGAVVTSWAKDTCY